MRTERPILKWTHAPVFALGSAGGFHLAYAPVPSILKAAAAILYIACLLELSRLSTRRKAFYVALLSGLLCVAPQAAWFWNIFGAAAIPLWLVLAFWIGLFVMLVHLGFQRLGTVWTSLSIPFLWTGLEYFRSELYYLKFSWLNIGYAFAGDTGVPFRFVGMYGTGFLIAAAASMFCVFRLPRAFPAAAVSAIAITVTDFPAEQHSPDSRQLKVAGIQMEFPLESAVPEALDQLVAAHPDAELLVVGEYTLDGPLPDELKQWCRDNRRYLIIGGKDPVPPDNFRDTAFVVDPEGDIIFKQGKSVPIQFFKDGLPAEKQALWESPWGKLGICVCYDLSYTRVTDRLIRMGAEALIVPTMDVVDWGEYEHELHARVAPVRAAEYRVPIVRVATSGVSQIVDGSGRVIARAPFAGDGEMLEAQIAMGKPGSVPLDRWAAPASTAAVVAFIFALIWKRPRHKRGERHEALEESKPLAATAAVQPERKTWSRFRKTVATDVRRWTLGRRLRLDSKNPV